MNFRGLRKRLQQGALIAYPTESCFGLGCDPGNRDAVKRLLRIKRRPQHKGLILVAADIRQLKRYIAPLSAEQLSRLSSTWPGPHTWLIPASKHCPAWLRGRHASIACRISAHPVVSRLCHGTGMALVSTSANRAGGKAIKSARECMRQFGRQVIVIPGRIGRRNRPSTIQDLVSGKILRK